MTSWHPDADRVEVLTDLVELKPETADTIAAVAALPWDEEQDLVQFTTQHAKRALESYVQGDLTAEDLESWAEVVHSRDDIGLDAQASEELARFLYEVSTPELFGGMTVELAMSWLSRLREGRSDGEEDQVRSG